MPLPRLAVPEVGRECPDTQVQALVSTTTHTAVIERGIIGRGKQHREDRRTLTFKGEALQKFQNGSHRRGQNWAKQIYECQQKKELWRTEQ